jgi:biopolymer transport protein ExbB
MWKVGGPVMWPIGAVSVAGLALMVYGFMTYRTDKMLRPDLVPQLQDSLGRLNIEEALATCNGNPALLTNVLAAGLQRISDGVLDVAAMEKAMEEAVIEETNEGMKPLNNLSVASQIAPMLGLLGTVTGMIGAFNKIGLGGMGDPEKLAGDIGEAMITTAAGLIVAIPFMFGYFFLKGMYLANVAKLSRVIGNLSHHLVVASRRAENGQPVPPAATPGASA